MTKTKTRFTAVLLALLCLATAVMLVACGSPSSSSSSSSASSEKIESSAAQDKAQTVDATGVRNILVIGDDKWEDEPPHADMMCLLRVDLDKHRVYEITVPRDTKYDFGGGDFGKLNNVLTRKGTEEQVKAVSSVIGEPIDYYVKIGFDTLEKIVDHFGGIQANLPYPIVYEFYTEDFPNEVFDAGEQTLTGWRAMAISRARAGYGDNGVNDQEMVRQYVDRQMLTTLMQVAYKGGVDSLEPLFKLFKDSVETNMKLDEMVAWAKALGSTGKVEVIGTTGPFYGANDPATKLWLVTPDPEGWSNLMAAVRSDGNIYEATTTYLYSVFPAATPATVVTEITVGS